MRIKNHIRKVTNKLDTSIEWINVRDDNDIYSNSWLYQNILFKGQIDSAVKKNKVLIVITTCRRLNKFLRTANALIKSLKNQNVFNRKYIENIVVIDDQSSEYDRNKMRSVYPDFKFIYKDNNLKGHAASLNMILYNASVVPSHINYVLYFEDDWVVKSNDENNRWFLNALELLQSNTLHQGRIGQVLLDVRHGGWPFGHINENKKQLQYRYHEFGYFELTTSGMPMVVNGKYLAWPGFSNQPSFWNLNRIRNKKLYFNVDDALFEQVFSLQYYQRGLRVACLEHETTFHIGDDVSAYKLNNEDSRYWDATD